MLLWEVGMGLSISMQYFGVGWYGRAEVQWLHDLHATTTTATLIN
jgi:hypothetical protein